jgi:hypothetical protein
MPYHWSYFIKTAPDESRGIAHQLRGMPGGFHYPGPEGLDLTTSEPPRDILELGEIDESKLDRIHGILKDLRIETSESSGWNCQNWALSGLDRLRTEGFVYDHFTQEAVKSWLKET